MSDVNRRRPQSADLVQRIPPKFQINIGRRKWRNSRTASDSDAGNIPFVMGGLGTQFPCGDSDALAQAIAGYADDIASADRDGREPVLTTTSGAFGLAEWHIRVLRHLEEYGAEQYEAGTNRRSGSDGRRCSKSPLQPSAPNVNCIQESRERRYVKKFTQEQR